MQVEFVYGFLFGQSVLLCLFIFIFYYFCLRHNTTKDGVEIQKAAYVQEMPTLESIADSEPETCDWLSAVLQSVYVSLRHRQLKAFVLNRIKYALSGDDLPDFIGSIRIVDFTLPTEMPQLREAAIQDVEGSNMTLLARVGWVGTMSVSVEVDVVLNYPVARFAVMPLALSVTLQRFEGLMRIFLPGQIGTDMSVCFDGDPILDFQLGTVIGAATRVHDPPKLLEIVVGRVHRTIHDKLVSPNSLSFAIPADILTSNFAAPPPSTPAATKSQGLSSGPSVTASHSKSESLSRNSSYSRKGQLRQFTPVSQRVPNRAQTLGTEEVIFDEDNVAFHSPAAPRQRNDNVNTEVRYRRLNKGS
ncbi:hypothetical protein SARC_03538 [Sphaeroforma arctica JP610]|uniref:SMP-LTD domain-containing protein n=1 Tax=Sphaeroforma arctica JP610 TaxID=667725 RepID=A0A0L0G7N5_9EUKA|nr:hypothetical protein SARC_03538 [Sphaeroforma arctica JP610]KNC84238.1 hypothetical protein SARC_03538 [Sphaeroforma arctica JP610]|eukprot:XP_014158140.1 hypothetical protein SARC_03538 [Sphaeroforma arctica JP610]